MDYYYHFLLCVVFAQCVRQTFNEAIKMRVKLWYGFFVLMFALKGCNKDKH